MASRDGTNVPLHEPIEGKTEQHQEQTQSDESMDISYDEPVDESASDPFVKLNPEEAYQILKYLKPDELLDAMRVSKLWKSTIESSAKVLSDAMDKIIFTCTNEQYCPSTTKRFILGWLDDREIDLRFLHRILKSKRKYKHMEGDATLNVGNQSFKNCRSSLVSARILCNFPGHEFSYKIRGGKFTKLQKLVIECKHMEETEDFSTNPCYHWPILNFITESSFPEVTHLRMCEFDSKGMSFNQLLKRFPKLKVLFIDDLPFEDQKFKYKVEKNQPRIEALYLDCYCRDLFIGFKDSLKEIYVGSINKKDVRMILIHCKVLERLTLVVVHDSDSLALIPHENLKALDVRYSKDFVLMELLRAMPALETLIFKCKVSSIFIEFLVKNMSQLKQFICGPTDIEIARVLTKFELTEDEKTPGFYRDFDDRYFNNDETLAVSHEDDVKDLCNEDLIQDSSDKSKQEKAFEVLLPELVKYLTFDERLDCMLVSKLWKSLIESSSMDKIALKQTPEKVGDSTFLSLFKIMRSKRMYQHMEGNCAISVGNYAFNSIASSLETLKIHCNMSEDHCKIASGNFIKLKKLFMKCDRNEHYLSEGGYYNSNSCYHRPILNFIKQSSFPEVTHLRICPWDPKKMSYDELYKKFPKLKVLYAYEDVGSENYESYGVEYEKFENQPKLESICMDTWSVSLLTAFKDTLTEVYIAPFEFDELAEIFQHLTNLKTFGIKEIPDDDFPRPFPQAKNLRKLIIERYPQQDREEDIMINFVESQPSITTLIVGHISENLLRSIATNMRNLRELIYARALGSAPSASTIELYESIRGSDDNQYANKTFEMNVDYFMRSIHKEFQEHHFSEQFHKFYEYPFYIR